VAKAGQAVQRAGGTDEVADPFAEACRLFEPGPGGGKVGRRRPPPRPGPGALYGRLTGRALPLVVLAGVCGLAVLALLTAGRPRGSRLIAALGVAAVIWGWGLAQYPLLLPGTDVTLTNAGATQATFVALVVVAIAAVILVVPSFALLYTLQGRGASAVVSS
jgi:hypothetical protein